MTPEQLLIPRYKVIADYPGSDFKVGQIIELENEITGEFSSVWNYNIYGPSPWVYSQSDFDTYPAIFRRMNWAEERKPEDLPEYVLATVDSEYPYNRGLIVKTDDILQHWKRIEFEHLAKMIGDCFEPSTEEEYLAQQKQP